MDKLVRKLFGDNRIVMGSGNKFSGNCNLNISSNGGSIVVRDGVVTVNGVLVDTGDARNITLNITGDVGSIDGHIYSVTVNGMVRGNVCSKSGDITCDSIGCDAETSSGDIDVSGNVGGYVKTSGDVRVSGSVGGSINTVSGDIKK